MKNKFKWAIILFLFIIIIYYLEIKKESLFLQLLIF